MKVGDCLLTNFLLAMGWQQFFVVLPIVYAVSDVDILDTDVDALNISPRAGINAELGPYGDLSFFVGATYLKAEVEVAGEMAGWGASELGGWLAGRLV